MCGNLPSCFAPLDDRGDRTNHMKSASLVETPACSCILLLLQAGKAGVFYSADKYLETGADPRNIFD